MSCGVIACDLGASSGRVFFSTLKNEEIEFVEVHRFINEPYERNGKLYWDVYKIIDEIENGIKKIINDGNTILSIGFDSWGVDYGWLDTNGKLIEDPSCYRDSGEKWKKVEKKLSKFEIFNESGINFYNFNSLYRINSDDLSDRKELLFMPNLIGYLLTSKKSIEYSIATTSGLINQTKKEYSEKIIDKIGLKKEELPKLVSAGTTLGVITDKKMKEYGCEDKFDVININCHDTASAIYSIGELEEDTGFIILGTWSIIGVVREKPILGLKSFELGITNEGISEEKSRVQHLIPGMWILQRLKKDFEKMGKPYTYEMINKLAKESKETQIVDLEKECLVYPENMIETLKELVLKKDYSDGDLLRIAYNSIVNKIKVGINNIEIIGNKKLKKVVTLGGGIQDKYLVERLSKELGVKIEKGYIEASVIGNAKCQYLSKGIITEEKWRKLNINFK